MQNKKTEIILGIGGTSRSGKTTLSRRLKAYFSNKRMRLFHLDEYAVPEDQIPTIRDRIDWESPASIDFLKLEKDIKAAIGKYEIIIAEGFLIYHYEPIRKLFDKKIYISIPENLFWERRVGQYYQEPDWYIQYVWDYYHIIHSHYRNICDLVIDGSQKLDFKFLVDAVSTEAVLK